VFEGILPGNLRAFIAREDSEDATAEAPAPEALEVEHLREAAREILSHFGGDPASSTRTGTAAEQFFSQVHRRFGPLVGQAGYRALLEEAHRRVMEEHPVLERFAVENHGNPFFGGLGTGLADAEPQAVWNGLEALTGEFLRLAQGIGRHGGVIMREGTPSGISGTKVEAATDRTRQGSPRERRDRHPADEMDGPSREKRQAAERKRQAHPWRILVMDRDRATCEAMAQALDNADDLTVMSYAVTVDEIKNKVSTEGIDFVIASAHLPTDEVLEVCRWLRQEHTGELPHVVVTGLPPDEAVILRFLESGAAAFTMEEFSVEGLRLTLRLLARGESVFPLRLQHLRSLRLSELAELVRDRGLNPDTLSELTKREGEVLLLMDEALTNREIARRLYISEGTVKSHVHQILRKLNVRDRNEAVRVLRLQRAAPGKLVLGRTGFRKER
jgi:two-component system NarL family response regulator